MQLFRLCLNNIEVTALFYLLCLTVDEKIVPYPRHRGMSLHQEVVLVCVKGNKFQILGHLSEILGIIFVEERLHHMVGAL